MFIYLRTVYLADTDAAGVVYFAKAMQMCHEAYEESLAAKKIYLQQYLDAGEVAIPIVHAEINFFRPLFCGDKLQIHLAVNKIQASEFAIAYQIYAAGEPLKSLVTAQTRHVCINPRSRTRIPLPEVIRHWINLHQE